MNKTRFDLALERGLAEGRQEGRALALRAAVLELLEAKFGTVPADLADRVNGIDDPAALTRWLIAAGQAGSLDDFHTRAGV